MATLNAGDVLVEPKSNTAFVVTKSDRWKGEGVNWYLSRQNGAGGAPLPALDHRMIYVRKSDGEVFTKDNMPKQI